MYADDKELPSKIKRCNNVNRVLNVVLFIQSLIMFSLTTKTSNRTLFISLTLIYVLTLLVWFLNERKWTILMEQQMDQNIKHLESILNRTHE